VEGVRKEVRTRSCHICLLLVLIPAIFFLLAPPSLLHADDTPFKACLLAHHTLALGDYWTTYHASFDRRYYENNWLTRQYWRSPPAFCVVKAVEVVLLDNIFKWVYKKSKFLGYAVVIVFGVVRYFAIKNNLEVMR